MKTYMVGATEQIYEICYVKANSAEEASSLGESVRTIDDYNKAVAAEEELEQNRS